MTTSRTITSAPALPITLQEVKEDLGIYHDEKDFTLQTFMEASVSFAERFTGQVFRCPGELFEQSAASMDDIELDYSPVTGVISVKYYNADNAETTLPAGNYTALTDRNPGKIEFNGIVTMPTLYNRADAVRVRYVAGYATPSLVPPDVRSAIMLTVRSLYESAGNPVKQMPTTAEWLLRNHRIK